jgi:1-deoxy-D-xylulose-5-phosphate synthase
LSAALGMCAARDKRGSDEQVVCVFGDAALTNGISFEAMNNIATTTKKFIGILNDNEWSIAKNVGAIANYLSKLTVSPSYNRLSKDVTNFVKKLPAGEHVAMLGQKAEEALKGIAGALSLEHSQPGPGSDGRGGHAHSVLFEEFGLRYLGPIDGHDLPLLVSTLEFAKTFDQPIVIHVLTKKGKGYEPSIKHPEKFHGLGPYDIETGSTPSAKPGTPPAYQDVFGNTMVKLCRNDATVVGITGAMPTGTGLKKLEDAMPSRYFDVGIAEEHAVIFAAGMATMGYRPVCAIYSTFLQRAYDCIHHDVCLQELPVIFCMDRAGLSANDGPTHHGLFDIAYLRCLPSLIAMAPKDEDELQDMMFTATKQKLPTFIRYPRGNAEGVPIKETPVELPIGKAEVLRNFANTGGPKVALFPLGNMQKLARETADKLAAEDCDCAIINPRFTKPLDADAHSSFAANAEVIITFEDHVLMGGYGGAVIELLNEKRIATPVVRIGWPDAFIEHASSVDYLRGKYGLTSDNACQKARAELARLGIQNRQQFAAA